jgi:hypothetical protein
MRAWWSSGIDAACVVSRQGIVAGAGKLMGCQSRADSQHGFTRWGLLTAQSLTELRQEEA